MTFLTAIVLTVSIVFLEFVFIGLIGQKSATQIEYLCTKHYGVASIGSTAFVGPGVVVCKDGTVKYE